MNPIEKKIRDAGGTILSEPLLDETGEINPKCAQELFAELDKVDRSVERRKRIIRANQKDK